MSRGDVRIQDTGGLSAVPTIICGVAASATIIYAGEPVKIETAAGTATVVKLADAEPVIGTTLQVMGIAAKDSTNTASVAGEVEVYLPMPGIVTWAAKAKSAAAVDTQAEIDALRNDCLLFDLTNDAFTIDTAAGHVITGGVQVVGGNKETKEVYFKFRPDACQGAVA